MLRYLYFGFFVWLCVVVMDHPQANDEIILQSIDSYMADIEHLSGGFTQVEQRGNQSNGKFYWRRPDRLRFEYALPDEAIIIANDDWLSIQEYPGAQANRYPINSTPLALFFDPQFRFATSPYVQSIKQWPETIEIILEDPQQDIAGRLGLFFTWPDISWLGWRVDDIQGQNIMVQLYELNQTAYLPAHLFWVEEIERNDD